MPDADDLVLVRRDDLRELLLDAVTLEKRTTHERRRSLWAAVNGEAATVEYQPMDRAGMPVDSVPIGTSLDGVLYLTRDDETVHYRHCGPWIPLSGGVGPWITQETP